MKAATIRSPTPLMHTLVLLNLTRIIMLLPNVSNFSETHKPMVANFLPLLVLKTSTPPPMQHLSFLPNLWVALPPCCNQARNDLSLVLNLAPTKFPCRPPPKLATVVQLPPTVPSEAVLRLQLFLMRLVTLSRRIHSRQWTLTVSLTPVTILTLVSPVEHPQEVRDIPFNIPEHRVLQLKKFVEVTLRIFTSAAISALLHALPPLPIPLAALLHHQASKGILPVRLLAPHNPVSAHNPIVPQGITHLQMTTTVQARGRCGTGVHLTIANGSKSVLRIVVAVIQNLLTNPEHSTPLARP